MPRQQHLQSGTGSPTHAPVVGSLPVETHCNLPVPVCLPTLRQIGEPIAVARFGCRTSQAHSPLPDPAFLTQPGQGCGALLSPWSTTSRQMRSALAAGEAAPLLCSERRARLCPASVHKIGETGNRGTLGRREIVDCRLGAGMDPVPHRMRGTKLAISQWASTRTRRKSSRAKGEADRGAGPARTGARTKAENPSVGRRRHAPGTCDAHATRRAPSSDRRTELPRQLTRQSGTAGAWPINLGATRCRR